METHHATDEAKVLVIYTGGTIGMLVGQHGYVPEPNFLTDTLRCQTRFHDPFQDSLFSNSSTVQGYRDWSSGRSTPHSTDSRFPDEPVAGTVLVRSTRPIGHRSTLQVLDPLHHKGQESTACSESRLADDICEAYLPTLVTPRTRAANGKTSRAIRYAILEWDPLLDSTNMGIPDWIRIATEIELNYSFDAFVILHGTDTMAYTSSALSFLLEDLGKAVIFTGAQIPMSQLRNDALDNLMGALTIAGNYIIPECCLYFNHTLYRGNRVTKMSSYDLNAFDSPNCAPLVKVGIDIVVNWNDVIRQTGLRKFRVHKAMSPHVATLRLFPGISATTVKAFCMPPVRGIILETFGGGNAPQNPEIAEAFKEACDRGVIIVAISQCAKGMVSDLYGTGRALLQLGVVPGGDMTPESALAKLSYLLSKTELSAQEVRDLIGTPLRGEITRTHSGAMQHPTVAEDVENIQNLLSQFVKLSKRHFLSRESDVSTELVNGNSPDSASPPWSWTPADAATTEAALLPFLIHLAAATGDTDSLNYCLKPTIVTESSDSLKFGMIPRSMVDCLDPGSGKSPLHVAALNGHVQCVELLLRLGALVHLRDTLGHTALYFAARQRHEQVVDMLVVAGATLGGRDEHFATSLVEEAVKAGDNATLRVWVKAGWHILGIDE